jgi:hypothetical protein
MTKQLSKTNTCDNKCAHGCSSHFNIVRLVENGRVNVLNLCDKALNEFKAEQIVKLSITDTIMTTTTEELKTAA